MAAALALALLPCMHEATALPLMPLGSLCAVDLVEANRVAFVSTVHVADDPPGEGFGMAHYVLPREKRLRSMHADECAYGPDTACTIDTNRPFTVRIAFSASTEPFYYNVRVEQARLAHILVHGLIPAARLTRLVPNASVEQEGRAAEIPIPIRYVRPPPKGHVVNAEEANRKMRQYLDDGMTLVLSHWA
jgi:hypothetical protein